MAVGQTVVAVPAAGARRRSKIAVWASTRGPSLGFAGRGSSVTVTVPGMMTVFVATTIVTDTGAGVMVTSIAAGVLVTVTGEGVMVWVTVLVEVAGVTAQLKKDEQSSLWAEDVARPREVPVTARAQLSAMQTAVVELEWEPVVVVMARLHSLVEAAPSSRACTIAGREMEDLMAEKVD